MRQKTKANHDLPASTCAKATVDRRCRKHVGGMPVNKWPRYFLKSLKPALDVYDKKFTICRIAHAKPVRKPALPIASKQSVRQAARRSAALCLWFSPN